MELKTNHQQTFVQACSSSLLVVKRRVSLVVPKFINFIRNSQLIFNQSNFTATTTIKTNEFCTFANETRFSDTVNRCQSHSPLLVSFWSDFRFFFCKFWTSFFDVIIISNKKKRKISQRNSIKMWLLFILIKWLKFKFIDRLQFVICWKYLWNYFYESVICINLSCADCWQSLCVVNVS